MTNDLHPDDDVVTLVRSAGLETDATFVADLRATLLAQADATTDDDTATNVISLTPSESDTRADISDRRRWPLLAAAAAVLAIGIGAIALVSQRTDDSATVTDDPPDIDDTIDDPVAFLDGSTWVAVGRFDEFPSSRTPVFTASAQGSDLAFSGSDGCNVGADGVLSFADGSVDQITLPAAIQSPCLDDQATPFFWAVGDRLAESDASRFVVVRNGSALVEFARLGDLTPATDDDLVGNWLLDRLAPVTIDADRIRVGLWGCVDAAGYRWSVVGGRLIVDDLHDDFRDRCDQGSAGFPVDDAEALIDLAEILELDAAVARFGEDVIVLGVDRAITLRPLPFVAPASDGITIAAGSAFGIRPAIGTEPEEVITAVATHLEQPTFDSGWVEVPRTVRVVCSEGPNEYRELHWNDLSFGFWRRGARVSLHYWIVGDRDELYFDVPDVGAPLDPPVSGLTTEHDVVVGDNIGQVVGPGIRRQVFDDGATVLVDVISQQGAGGYTATDGRITSIISVNNTC